MLFPALLIAYQPAIKLPSYFIYNEFYLFKEEKFSTSRQHAVWAKDITKKGPVDALRYYLAATRPEFEKTNFSYPSFAHTINSDLSNDLTGWLQNLAQRITDDFQDICPDGGEWNVEHQEFIDCLRSLLQQYEKAFQLTRFSPASVISLAKELIRRIKKLSTNTQLLRNQSKTCQLEYQTGVVLELTAAKYQILCVHDVSYYAQFFSSVITFVRNF